MSPSSPLKVLSGSGVVAASQLAGTLLSFLRNMIIARLLIPEESSIAFALTTYMMTAEAVLSIGLERMVVIWDGDDLRRFEGAGHLVSVIRGTLLAILMLAAAPLVSDFIKMPEYTSAFMWVAVASFFRSFLHLDIYRQQRQMRFIQMALCEVIPLAISTALTYLAALYYRDYRAILVAIFSRQILFVLMSHLMARDWYGFTLDRVYVRQYLAFGIPLLLTGILSAFTVHADKYFVGYAAGNLMFGYYTVAMMFVDMPMMVFGAVQASVGSAWLKEASQDSQRLDSRRVGILELSGLLAVLMVGGVGLIGPPVLVLFFGDKYADSSFLLPLLSGMRSILLMRAGLGIVALAEQNSRYTLVNSLIRVGVSLVAMVTGIQYGIYGVIGGAILGEMVALLAGVYLLPGAVEWKGKMPVMSYLTVTVSSLGMGVLLTSQKSIDPVWRYGGAILLFAVTVVILLFLSTRLITYFNQILHVGERS